MKLVEVKTDKEKEERYKGHESNGEREIMKVTLTE